MLTLSVEELKEIIRAAVKEEMNQKKEKELMSFAETIEFLGISASALNKWKAENKIPYKKLGKRIFFSRADVTKAMTDSNYFQQRELN